MTAPALICDTGALLDYVWPHVPDHPAFRVAIDAARTRFLPALVLTEVDYFLRADRASMHALLAEIDRGAFTLAPLDGDLLRRAAAVDRQYASLRLGLVDASIVALAERLGITRIATRDFRHFGAVALADGRRFEMVVQATGQPRTRG